MVIDISNSFDDSREKLKSFKSFNQVKSAYKKATSLKGNITESANSKTKTALDKINKLEGNIQKKINDAKNNSTSFDQLLDLIVSTKGAGNSTNSYLKKKLVKVVQEIKPKIFEILIESIISSLGCSQEQEFNPGDYYIKVSSVDIQKLLITSPSSTVGKCAYEKIDFSNTTQFAIPRSTNKMMYSLIQSPGIPLSVLYSGQYRGLSNGDLFDIEYTNVDDLNNQGYFFKVTVLSRPNGNPNRVTDFLVDYYKTIDIMDYNNFVNQLIDLVFSIFSVEVGFGSKTIDDRNKMGIFIQRILGLCFDSDEEIDVGGQAKYPELDNSNEDFFEVTGIEQRDIDEKTELTQRGVVQFASCDNVILPVTNTEYVSDIISNVDENNIDSSIDNILDSLVNDERWSLTFPFPNQLKLNLDTDLIKNFPKAVVSALLTPKLLLGFVIMSKCLGVMYDDTVLGIENFFKQNKKFVERLISNIGAIFVKVLFDEIAKDVLRLAKTIIKDIANERAQTVLRAINSLVNAAVLIAQTIDDFRKCRSLIQTLLQLFNLRLPFNSQILPTPILALSNFAPGASANRAFLNHIEQLQKAGIPTGPNTDGSPNLMLISDFCAMQGMYKERDENGKVEIFIPSLLVAQAGTLPSRASGKYF
jgi:hypothetical protein